MFLLPFFVKVVDSLVHDQLVLLGHKDHIATDSGNVVLIPIQVVGGVFSEDGGALEAVLLREHEHRGHFSWIEVFAFPNGEKGVFEPCQRVAFGGGEHRLEQGLP